MPRIPNDTYFDQLWYLSKIGATEAWNTTFGFEGVTVAVIDSGVDLEHPDLRDNIWTNPRETPGNGVDDDGNGFIDDGYGWNFVENNNNPRPDISKEYSVLGVNHGTIAAGLIAAKGDNGTGTVGVTWQTRIMAIRALDSNGYADPVDIARAVNYAVNNGAKVINLSFIGSSYNTLLDVALQHAYDTGVTVVAAAGNAPEGKAAIDLAATPLYPICFDRASKNNYVIGVVATDEIDMRADFSNYGVGCVDISAPGVRILATQFYRPQNPDFIAPYGGYYNGTSLAAPIVSGAVALLKSVDQTLTPAQMMILLRESADTLDGKNPLYIGKLGAGRLNVARAVALVLDKKRATKQLGNNKRSKVSGSSVTRALVSLKISPNLIATAPGLGRPGEVRIFSQEGVFVRGFFPFGERFVGGLSLATATGVSEKKESIVVGAINGGNGLISVYTIDGQLVTSFLAYGKNFFGGVKVVTIDTNGDGKDEIVVTATRGPARQKIFSLDGQVLKGKVPKRPTSIVEGSTSGRAPLVNNLQNQVIFFAYESGYRGGVEAAILSDN